MKMEWRKRKKRIIYAVREAGKGLLNEFMEGFLFLLWISAPPYGSKIFYSCLEDTFSSQRVYLYLHRLYRKGFIHKIKKDGSIFFTSKKPPQDIIFNDLERLRMEFFKKKWNGRWWLIIYDIPERRRSKRDLFRMFIKELGFGKVKESCWISPYDFSRQIYDFTKRENIIKYICLHEGRLFTGKSIDATVEEIWHLKELNEKYEEVIELCKEGIEKVETESLSPSQCYNLYLKVFLSYKKVIKEDPFLPQEFLKNWKRNETEKMFEKFSKVASRELQFLSKKRPIISSHGRRLK
jgi:phenylacetic acid degradation operon negative regulatory protein